MKRPLLVLAVLGLGLGLAVLVSERRELFDTAPAKTVSAAPAATGTAAAGPGSEGGGAAPTVSSETGAGSLASSSGNGTGTLNEVVRNPLAEQIGLALEGISLFQGDKGAELWRLKASFAHLARDGEDINVDKPVVRYTLGPPGSTDYLDVVAEKGRITDHQRHILLQDQVVVTRGTQRVTAPRLEYDAATRVMRFPDGASLDAPGHRGHATLFSWNLATNVMEGEKGVEVVFKARPEASGGATAPGTGETPADLPGASSGQSGVSPVPVGGASGDIFGRAFGVLQGRPYAGTSPVHRGAGSVEPGAGVGASAGDNPGVPVSALPAPFFDLSASGHAGVFSGGVA